MTYHANSSVSWVLGLVSRKKLSIPLRNTPVLISPYLSILFSRKPTASATFKRQPPLIFPLVFNRNDAAMSLGFEGMPLTADQEALLPYHHLYSFITLPSRHVVPVPYETRLLPALTCHNKPVMHRKMSVSCTPIETAHRKKCRLLRCRENGSHYWLVEWSKSYTANTYVRTHSALEWVL